MEVKRINESVGGNKGDYYVVMVAGVRIFDDKWAYGQHSDELLRDISVLCCLEMICSITKIKIFLQFCVILYSKLINSQ